MILYGSRSMGESKLVKQTFSRDFRSSSEIPFYRTPSWLVVREFMFSSDFIFWHMIQGREFSKLYSISLRIWVLANSHIHCPRVNKAFPHIHGKKKSLMTSQTPYVISVKFLRILLTCIHQIYWDEVLNLTETQAWKRYKLASPNVDEHESGSRSLGHS